MYPGSSCVLGLNIRRPPPGQTQQTLTVPSPWPHGVLCYSLSAKANGKSFSAAFKMFLMALLSNLTTPKQPWWSNWLAAKPQHLPSMGSQRAFQLFPPTVGPKFCILGPGPLLGLLQLWALLLDKVVDKPTCLGSADTRTMTSLIWWMQWGPETIFPRFTRFCQSLTDASSLSCDD